VTGGSEALGPNGTGFVRLLRSPWLPVLVGLAVIALAAAVAPSAVALAVAALAVASWLVWKFGLRAGLWLLFLASIPYREPLSIDVHGTASLFPTDLLLVGLLVEAAFRGEVRRLWRSSTIFKIGLAILVLSLPGLMTATRFFWGVTSVYRVALQVAVFVVASSMVRSGRDAMRALLAVLIGFVPAVAYGFYQANLPYGAELPEWAHHLTSWTPEGKRVLRIFSTFDHTLRFSHYLTIAFGLSVGLAFSSLKRAAKVVVLVIGAATAYCNLLTASVGGVFGTLAAVVTGLVLGRRRAALLLPILVVALVVMAPPNLTDKAGRVLSGRSATLAARLVTYRQGINIVSEHPLLGVGWGGIFTSLKYTHRISRAEPVAFGVENYFLQRAVALGIPGLALYLSLFVLFFRNLSRTRGSPVAASWPVAAVLTGGVALYVQAQGIPTTAATTNLVLWLLFALSARMAEESGPGARALEVGQ
jgi:hypothetical protein